MKTKNLVIIFILFLLITLASGLVVFFTKEKNQPVFNEISGVVIPNNLPAEKNPGEMIKGESVLETANKTKPTVQSEKTVSPETDSDKVEQIQVTMLIDGVEYRAVMKPDSSVYDLMNLLKEQKKIDFKGSSYAGLGFFVQEINGVRNNPPNPLPARTTEAVQSGGYQGGDGENWFYYVNGQPAQVGISYYLIKANDIIEWKYENKSF